MTQVPLPPPPRMADWSLFRWLTQIYVRLTEQNQIAWDQLDKADSALSDIVDRSHSTMQNVLGADATSTDTTQSRHVSNAQAKSWTDTATAVSSLAADITDLDQTVSASYTQAEVQAISDKVDEILAELRSAG